MKGDGNREEEWKRMEEMAAGKIATEEMTGPKIRMEEMMAMKEMAAVKIMVEEMVKEDENAEAN